MRAMITQELVRNLQPEAKPYEVRDPRLKGFLLRVQPTGVMTYYAEYGRGKRHRIGPADALAPSQAREEAKRVLAGVALGDDPAAARREAKAHTLRSFLDEVYEPWAKANIRTPKNTLRPAPGQLPGPAEQEARRDQRLGGREVPHRAPEGRHQGDHRQPRPR